MDCYNKIPLLIVSTIEYRRGRVCEAGGGGGGRGGGSIDVPQNFDNGVRADAWRFSFQFSCPPPPYSRHSESTPTNF